MGKTSKSLSVTQEAAPNDDEVIVIRTTEAKLKEAENKILELQNVNEVPKSLGQLSAVACLFQFIQATILFVLASKKDQKWSWYTNYPNPDGFSTPEPNKVAAFSVLYYSPAYIFMSGIEHLACWVFRDTYTYYIAHHQNPFRWTEYTFSASLMRVMIAQLVGITDIHLLFCIFVLTALTIQCGATFESVNAKARADGLQKKWRPFFVAWISQLSTWFIIFNYFAKGVSDGNGEGFLWGIVIILFLLDSSFAILFSLQWAEIEPFHDFVTGEKAFILLSFTAKTFLAWMSLAGVFNTY